MSFLSRRVSTSIGSMLFWLIALILCLAALMVGLISPTVDPASASSKLFAVAAGLLAGLMVMLGQYVIEWKKDIDLNIFRKTRIKDVLLTRDDEEYYRKMIQSSTIQIDVLGVTAARFLNDFASEGNPRPDKRVLLDALQREVRVRILVAARASLPTQSDLNKHDGAKEQLRLLAAKFPDLFHYRYYAHTPTHSIVVCDSDCLLGPIFAGVDSKITPAVRSERAGDFAGPYLRYFEAEWESAAQAT